MRTFTKFNDCGHGWLRVPTNEFLKAGVQELISSCSYVSPMAKYVYLEEDCDQATFEAAYKGAYEITNVFTDNDSSIRRLQPYLWEEIPT